MTYFKNAARLLLIPIVMTVAAGCQQPIQDGSVTTSVMDNTEVSSPASVTDKTETTKIEVSSPASVTDKTETTKADSSSTVSADKSSPVNTTSPTSVPANFDLGPGRYCYSLDDGILDTALRLTIDQNSQVAGDTQATIQNDEVGYYTSYSQLFSGRLTDNQAAVDVTTWIEYDVQETQETWTLTSSQLEMDNAVLEMTDCQTVNPRFQNDDGLEASDLLGGAAAVHTQRVEFAPGTSSATVSNSVIRGERDVYLLRANGGQQMTLAISALEDNAVFDVVSPSGFILALEATEETVFLPQVGDYQVIVGGTRGNASYELAIGIE